MYTLTLEKFQGPFNLLLQLIEKEKMDITEVSLAQVTDEFLHHLEKVEQVQPDELADFLEIAAKLIFIKSKLLVPGTTEEDEEGQDLVGQLKIYQQYMRATKEIGRIASQPIYSFARERIPLEIVPHFSLETKITTHILEKYFKNLSLFISEQIKFNQQIIKRKVVSLQAKIRELIEVLSQKKEIIFDSLIKGKEKAEKIATFLAVLELVKRRQAVVSQAGLFEKIIVTKNKE
ncbi:MAG: segregation/condensation protein A [Patescibacteria group bacterium]|nr:segregation/condensation protein A [Patescibacteria group bacterium]MDD5172958.1 segregation/condensation protein A [Patescibacteria group bacterium]